MKTTDGKLLIDWLTLNPFYFLEETVNIVKFDLKSTVGDENKALAVGQTVEVRGVVNSKDTLSFEDMTQFEGDFGKFVYYD